MKARNLVVAFFVFVLIGFGWWLWRGVPAISMGRSVPLSGTPYQHLTYNKLAPDHHGNFTGDVYLLDVAKGEPVQLTKGGITGSAKWINAQEMLVTHRPKGSVVDPFYLDMSTGRLSVADDKIISLLFYKNRFESGFSPSRAYYTVHVPNADGSGDDQYAILKIMEESGGAEIIKTISTAVFAPPAWTPNSEMLVYSQFDQQICLLALNSLEEVCMAGTNPVVAPSGQPALVAFLERAGGDYKVCTAEIDELAFTNVECHDENRQQITDLAWRP